MVVNTLFQSDSGNLQSPKEAVEKECRIILGQQAVKIARIMPVRKHAENESTGKSFRGSVNFPLCMITWISAQKESRALEN